MNEPTIFAKASGAGRAAIAVIRLSGPASAEALRRLTGRLPEPRIATLLTLRDPSTGDPLDRALVLWFPGPKSFTGEDAAEFHLHGGRAVSDAVLKALSDLSGLRPAEPGEFTRRAFQNGKMDLTEVEALADLIEAETESQRRQALRQLEGALGQWAGALREALIEAQALAEAMIDFADEDDVAAGFDAELRRRVTVVATEIDLQLARARQGEKLRDGLVVAITGPPNVGKSTLLNRLAGRDVAIVSPYAGTTRDAIEVDLDLNGYAVRLVDTAGLRDTVDPIEQEGISRAHAKAASADLVLWLDDASSSGMKRPPIHGIHWTVTTKSDLSALGSASDFTISAKTGAGIEDLVAALAALASRVLAGAETAVVTRLRHRQALETARHALGQVMDCDSSNGSELIAEDLRHAVDALAGLIGRVETEEILGGIFARFCIGK